jgi:hypothetical protein
MKKFSVLAFCIVTFGIISVTRSQTAGADSWKNVTLGPFFMPGASANAGSVANGAKTDVADFSWSLGAMADIPFSPSFGLQLSACYDSRAVGFYDQKSSNNYVDYSFSYFSIRPEFMIGDFLIGLGLGIPVGASTTQQNEPTPSIGASNMNFLIEGRIGASIPVVVADNGNSLRFIVDASYAFSQITTAPLAPAFGSTDKTDNNGPLGTLQLGFAYMFNLNPH